MSNDMVCRLKGSTGELPHPLPFQCRLIHLSHGRQETLRALPQPLASFHGDHMQSLPLPSTLCLPLCMAIMR
eukprot:scaffold321674_cov21-Tisochrysis_lutea.AAC.1